MLGTGRRVDPERWAPAQSAIVTYPFPAAICYQDKTGEAETNSLGHVLRTCTSSLSRWVWRRRRIGFIMNPENELHDQGAAS